MSLKPRLSLDTVSRAAAEVARTHAFPVSVVGSVPHGDGSRYIEIVFRIECAHEDRGAVQVGVFRDVDVQRLRSEIGTQLKRVMEPHSRCETRMNGQSRDHQCTIPP